MRLVFALLCSAFVLAGCGLIPEGTRAPFERVEPQTKYFAANKAEVFNQLVKVLETMGYSIDKEQPARGVVEASGRLLESNRPGSARQFLIYAKIREIATEEAAVELMVREVTEGEFKAGATSVALGEHGRYESIFEGLEAALGKDSLLPSAR